MRRALILAGVAVGLVALLTWGASAYAAQKEELAGHAARLTPQERVDRLARFLDLTEPQKTAILAIMEARCAQVKAVIQDQNLTRPEKRARVRQIVKSTHDSIRALLNADQQAKFDKLCGKIKERIRERIKERLDLPQAAK